MKAVIIYSGGLDSSVLLHKYKDQIKLAVTFDYGAKHNKQEYARALYNTNLLKIKHLQIPLSFMNEYFKSDLLLSGGEVPEGHYDDPSMKQIVVPFRNGILLSVAVGLAESMELDTVLIGNHEASRGLYPDVQPEFTSTFSKACELGTYAHVKVWDPFINYTKRIVALVGKDLPTLDFANTYSCHKGTPIHCGMCGTCVERKEALEGFDPTQYLQ